MTIIAVYHKYFGKRDSIFKFFDTREEADRYLMSDELWGSKTDDMNREYRENTVRKGYEIVEMPLSEVLNIIKDFSNELEARLDSHNM